MQISTVLLIILAAVVSLCIAVFQYFYKVKRQKSSVWLTILRFISIFSALLLLINPKFTKEEYYIEKANLIVLTDNSTSIPKLDGDIEVLESVDKLKASNALSEKYTINSYTFGKNIEEGDSTRFNESITNVARALNSVNEIYENSSNVIVLLSDGNQTLGTDYEYLNLSKNLHIYPIVVGDTTTYLDLRVNQVNVNKYTFLKNKFPVEANILYTGNSPVNSIVRIYLDGKQVFRELVSFRNNNSSKTINALIEASSVGIKSLKIEVDVIDNEKNKTNNIKEFAIEVIDEKTNVGLVTSITHPDIGALKKVIEANEQREVQILNPNASEEILENIDVFILYQPNTTFENIYSFLEKRGGGKFTITGTKTDWNFLNKVQSNFKKDSYNQLEEVIAVKNQGFGLFDISGLSLLGFPPLESGLGELNILKPYETIATQRIKGVDLDTPLFFVINDNSRREAVLAGENIWKWRVQTYRDERSFKNFDDFIGKLLLYLSEVKQKSRLNLDYENLYDGNSLSKISASYFDNSYTFDANANLNLKLNKLESSFTRESPMLLKGSSYEYSLEDLESGTYEFTVTASKEKISKSGKFKILDFDLENQFLSANYKKLRRLSDKNRGQTYFPNHVDELIDELTNDNRFTPIQKSKRNVVSLIDFRYLLILMVLTLSAEWFIRKYNGLL
ncbi:VWA domain-containing protein [uncultured Croceitalea sp.]|uniref:VWA domain-containing protein n=1 Tax=uncultured Croceitalea sp. TaxID=1798908 RepID=UPI00374EB35E